MQFFTCVSDHENTDDAIEHVVDSTQSAIEAIDALFVFFTAHHREQAEQIVEQLWLELDPQCAIGCMAQGVIGEVQEIERAPGLAVMTANLAGGRLHPFHVGGATAWRQILEDREELRDRLGLGDETRAVLMLGDPYSTPLDPFFAALAGAAPPLPVIGGMASGARGAGRNVLLRNDEIATEGIVGLTVSGPIDVRTLVSQGARPIGQPLVVTKSHDNVIEQLGGRSALAALQGTIAPLPPADRALLQNGLLLGRAISEYRDTFGRGDFLIRNVMDVDQENGTISVGDFVRTGQTVQFHVRDAATADEDLRLLLAQEASRSPAAGALLFSCNGRGTQLFQQPGHDIRAARTAMPTTPVAGFFAAGEFGPVGDRNFIHGHTASFALFRPRVP